MNHNSTFLRWNYDTKFVLRMLVSVSQCAFKSPASSSHWALEYIKNIYTEVYKEYKTGTSDFNVHRSTPIIHKHLNSNIPKNRSSRWISNTLWFLFREIQTDSVSYFFVCIISVPIKDKSVQNISINNFQLNKPNSIIEINKHHFSDWQNHKSCTYSWIRCNQSQS